MRGRVLAALGAEGPATARAGAGAGCAAEEATATEAHRIADLPIGDPPGLLSVMGYIKLLPHPRHPQGPAPRLRHLQFESKIPAAAAATTTTATTVIPLYLWSQSEPVKPA